MRKVLKKVAKKASLKEEILFNSFMGTFAAIFQSDRKIKKTWFPRIRCVRDAFNVILGE